MNKKKTFNWIKQNAIMFAFVVIFIFFSVASPVFTRVDNLINITRQVSFIGTASVGMMFVLLTGGIDLSVGSLVQVINVLCATLMVKHGVSPFWAILLMLILAAFSGLVNGSLIAKLKIPPMIVTMASMNILNGAAYLISGGQPVYGFSDAFNKIGQGYLWIIPIPTIVMFVSFIIGGFILNKTYVGRCYYAVGGNEEASRLSGLDVDKTKILAYVCSSVTACIAGIMMMARLASGTPNTGKGFEFQIITAVVLGGVSVSGGAGRLFSVVFGVLIIGVLNNGLTLLGFNTYWQYIVNGVVLVLAVTLDYTSKARSNTISDAVEENSIEA